MNTDSSTTANLNVVRRIYEARERVQSAIWLARVPVLRAQIAAMRGRAN